MGSHDRDIKHLAGKHIRCADTSADHSGSGSIKSGIRSLSTAETKFHDTVSLCRMDNTGCFCRDQALMIDDIQDRSLHKLCLHDRSDDF